MKPVINSGGHCFILKQFFSILTPCPYCSFAFADSHSRERRGANFQPQPGRQHQQIPRYHLAHSQGNRQQHAKRRSTATWENRRDFQMRAFTATLRTTAHIHHTHSLFYCPFCSFHHSSVSFSMHTSPQTPPVPPPAPLLCPVCNHLSLFKTFPQQLFGHLIVCSVHSSPRREKKKKPTGGSGQLFGS